MNELIVHCTSAELAYTALVMALSERSVDGALDFARERKVFVHVDSFLMHAAMITRILWPVCDVHEDEIAVVGEKNAGTLRSIREARGGQLRDVLGKEVALLENLGLWDYLERQDARLEVWALTSSYEVSAEMVIGPEAASNGVRVGNAVRNIDSVSMTYTFLGERFDLSSIAAVLSWIHRAATKWKAT